MGYLVEVDGRVVWEPSRLVAELFISQVRGVEGVFEISSGLTVPMADEIHVDVSVLRGFLNGAAEILARSGGRDLELLAGGPVRLGIDLYEKCVGEAYVPPAGAETVVRRIRAAVGSGLR